MVEKRLRVTKKLNNIFQEVFDNDAIEIGDGMTADDIQEWDSLIHITLIVAVEKEFDLRLNSSEIGKFKNVGALIDLLTARSKD